ncbi:oligosaccharide flippase family protein [Kingella kingae]|uniref:oligosaccharide flippase family protein n=1 Tax=Kingella kingae TaxID=504 RepID=UPI0013DF2523|nr:oligosaccharide flippase family protein [Kingella kingae]MBD3614131.1 oligosaccharide flippase family protein [Kingella kingae]MBD3632449.1 oligosaccharide flippase family protein [Kingella kingae]MBD3659842.1 oligosaccharide flippase family protein [Kingella kingae]QIF41076.1 oligosaccharide flippase family protein [Kingella kingae]
MKILKDSFIYLFGELFAKALPFLLLPYLTRKLGTAGFGELSYYQTLVSLLAIIFGLSQDGALARYYYFYGKRNLPNVMITGYIYIFALTAISLLFAWQQQSLVLAAVIFAAATQTVLGSQLAYRQCQKRALAYTAIQIGSGVLSSILTVTALELTTQQPITMRFTALFVANAIIALTAYFIVQKERKPRLTWQRFYYSASYIFAFGVPLLLHHASGFVKGQLDRIVIYQQYPAEQLGIYAAALQLASIVSVFLMAVNKATVPYYYQALKQSSLHATKIRKWALCSLLISPIFALIAFMLPEAWFTWFLGANYIGTQNYICLFLIGFGLTIPYYLLVNYLFYHAKNKLIASISLMSTGVYLAALFASASLSLQWIPYAMIAGNVAILPILYYFVREPK